MTTLFVYAFLICLFFTVCGVIEWLARPRDRRLPRHVVHHVGREHDR